MQASNYKINKPGDVIYSIRNMVYNIVITLYGESWILELLWSFRNGCKCSITGFPGGAVVENLPANVGNTGSSPGLGRSHMLRSSWAREPQLLSLHVWSLCSTTREAAIVRGPCTAMKSGPRSPQLEKALAQKRRPNTAKNKLKIYFLKKCSITM